MDITTDFGSVVPGSNPGRGTDELARMCSEACLRDMRPGFEDLVSILWSGANRKSTRCTDPVRIERSNRGPGRGTS